MGIAKNEQISALALELVEDAELARISAEAMVLKASRLARLVGDEETIQWLWYERLGYVSDDEIARKYLALTSRWIDPAENKAYFASITVHETMLVAHQHELEAIKKFAPSGTYALMQLKDQQDKIMAINNKMVHTKKIVAAVRAQVQQFASRVYSEKLFSHQAGTIVEQYQQRVDALIAATAHTAFSKLPHAFERLSVGDREAISHALTTCRRVIDSVADAVFPASDTPFLIGQQKIEVGEQHTRNRLRAHIYGRIGNCSRYERLNKSLGSLYDRVSAGVHVDVGVDEAQALVLQTYLFLGELLSLPEPLVSEPSEE